MDRQKGCRRSKLDEYCDEICLLSWHGASLRDIEAWLRIEKNQVFHHTTIHRYLRKISKSNEGGNYGQF